MMNADELREKFLQTAETVARSEINLYPKKWYVTKAIYDVYKDYIEQNFRGVIELVILPDTFTMRKYYG